MLRALVLDNENRIMDFIPASGAPEKYPVVDEETLPKGEINNYKYIGGEYVYDPLPEELEPELEPTTDEVLNVLLGIGGEA